MPNPYDIQEAIAALIETAAPTAVVVPRNILGELETGNWSILQSSSDSDRIHGWFITQEADSLSKAFQNYAEYDATFGVWQVYQYRTGTNAANSEKEFATEREAVKAAFLSPLDAPLENLDPLSFYEIGLFPRGQDGGRLIHMAKARCVARGLKVGC